MSNIVTNITKLLVKGQQMERIAIVDGVRTPFCKMNSAFNHLSAQELGRLAARELIEKIDFDPAELDEVIIGNVCQPMDAANIARVIALYAGVPKEVPAFTVNRNCASGIESAVQAQIKILANQGDCYLVGGTESMSNVPFYFSKKYQEFLMQLSKFKSLGGRLRYLMQFKLKFLSPRIGLQLGLTDPVCGMIMGLTAEVLAKEFGITRKQQDEFALESHQRAIAARESLAEEIIPVIPSPDYKNIVKEDNGPRKDQSIEALQKLRPYFDRKSGSVTAGNSSQITDGSAMLLIMSESKAKSLGYQPLGYMRASAFVGVDPRRMGIGPAHAIPQVLKKAQLSLKEIQAIEINEAFAVQVLACLKALSSDTFSNKHNYQGFTGDIDPSILNVNGGSIALGHPVGSTGARLILTMLKHLKRNNLNLGLVSLCVGGGQGAAMVLER